MCLCARRLSRGVRELLSREDGKLTVAKNGLPLLQQQQMKVTKTNNLQNSNGRVCEREGEGGRGTNETLPSDEVVSGEDSLLLLLLLPQMRL